VKPALYIALVSGYSSSGLGRLMAVTSEKGGPGRTMIYGRDLEHGYPTHRRGGEIIAKFENEDSARKALKRIAEIECELQPAIDAADRHAAALRRNLRQACLDAAKGLA
jgi:hypothetical protein